jgi:hypothetical protein
MLFATFLITDCHHVKPLQGPHPQELSGTWQLLIRSSCDQYGVKSDTLVLRNNGSFDQHVSLSNGTRMDITAQSWTYDSDGTHSHIALDKRAEFFTPEMFGIRAGEGKQISESLIVQLNPEPVILLNPDWDCVYVKAQ